MLTLSANELLVLALLINNNPRYLSPLQLHQRYQEADAISDTVGTIVREHDARRIRQNKT